MASEVERLGEDGPLARAVLRLDLVLERLADLFLVIANVCLALMLLGTASTILLRPLGLSYYWIWPWTMQVFVWMTFFGFYAVYRRGKDITVDFLMQRLGDGAMRATRVFSALVVMLVTGVILSEVLVIMESQVGVIDGVITPWGTELERYTLSVPLYVSSALIFTNAGLELAKAWLGWPERHDDPVGDE